MPELPEVENIRRRLNDRAAGRLLSDLHVRDERLLQNCAPGEIREALVDSCLNEVERRGKYMLFTFEEHTLVNHLRMSGRWLEEEGDRTRLVLRFEPNVNLFMDDLRRLGTAHLFETENVMDRPPIDGLGVEPLSEGFTPEALGQLCTTGREVKRLLLDQSRIAGLGNIYTSEALFRGRVHPERDARSLSKEELVRLHDGIRETLRKAIQHEGTSFDGLYRTPSGQPGRFQHRLLVYDREGEDCPRCGREIHRIKQGQRSSFLCPNCQEG